MRHTTRRVRLLAGALLLAITCTFTGAQATEAEEGVYITTLRRAVASLPVRDEENTGYKRTSFKHWTDADSDGCPTRTEVLQEEALSGMAAGSGCALAGGKWLSYYDGQEIDDAKKLDVDHVVPLVEAWGSGASAWSAERREAYANDLDDPRALVAVSARQNRSKGGKDPAEWLPSDADAHCRYAGEWTAVKLRWGLSADGAEHETLTRLAASCPDARLGVILAPAEG